MLLRFCSSSILPLLEGSSNFFSCQLFEAISSRKYLSLFDQYFNLPKFSSRVLTSAGLSSFLNRQSLDPWAFFTVFLTDFDMFSFYFQGLEKEIDFLMLPWFLGWGRLCSIEWTISWINLSRGFEIGPISDRLKAAMILRISIRLPSELFLLSSLEYSSKQLDITLKSQIFSLIFSEKLTWDCFRLVTVELPFCLSSAFLLMFITLIVCLLFLLGWQTRLPLLSFVTEWLERVKIIEAAWDLTGSGFRSKGSFSSVLSRVQLGVRQFLRKRDPFFLCLDYWC